MGHHRTKGIEFKAKLPTDSVLLQYIEYDSTHLRVGPEMSTELCKLFTKMLWPAVRGHHQRATQEWSHLSLNLYLFSLGLATALMRSTGRLWCLVLPWGEMFLPSIQPTHLFLFVYDLLWIKASWALHSLPDCYHHCGRVVFAHISSYQTLFSHIHP